VSPMFFLGFLIHFSRFASLPRSFCLLAAAPSHDKTQLRANDEQMPPQTLNINHFKPYFRGASATPSGKLFQRRFSGTCPGSQASCIWRSQTCLPCLCTRVHRRADTDRHRHAHRQPVGRRPAAGHKSHKSQAGMEAVGTLLGVGIVATQMHAPSRTPLLLPLLLSHNLPIPHVH
jgi:hypothetical protein